MRQAMSGPLVPLSISLTFPHQKIMKFFHKFYIIKYDLTRILKGKGMEINFKVSVVKDGDHQSAIATPTKLKLMPFYLRRMVRKGTNYVEDSFVAKCKDGDVIIKPFLITRRKVSRAVRKAIRNMAKEELTNELKDKEINELFDDILRNKIQKPLSLKLKKIYPLSLCEIRVLEIVKQNNKS